MNGEGTNLALVKFLIELFAFAAEMTLAHKGLFGLLYGDRLNTFLMKSLRTFATLKLPLTLYDFPTGVANNHPAVAKQTKIFQDTILD